MLPVNAAVLEFFLFQTLCSLFSIKKKEAAPLKSVNIEVNYKGRKTGALSVFTCSCITGLQLAHHSILRVSFTKAICTLTSATGEQRQRWFQINL